MPHPHGSIKTKMLTKRRPSTPHLHHMSGASKGNIGDGASLVPLVDIDCMHDDDHLMDTPHTMSSTCLDVPPIYDEYDDERVEFLSCDATLHRISCENSIGHIMFDNPLNLSYAMSEISHIASLQSHRSNYAYPNQNKSHLHLWHR